METRHPPASEQDQDPQGPQSAGAGAPAGTCGEPPVRTLGQLCRADFIGGLAVAVAGCLAFVVAEIVAVTYAYHDHIGVGIYLRLELFALGLAPVLWLLLAPVLGLAAVAARMIAWFATAHGRDWPGLFAPRRRERQEVMSATWYFWGVLTGAAIYIPASTYLTYDFSTRFKAPLVTAILLAGVQLGLFLFAAAAGLGGWLLSRWAGRALQPRLGAFNPFGRVAPALVVVFTCAVPAVMVALRLMPQLRSVVPWRDMLALGFITVGVWGGAWSRVRYGSLLPVPARHRRAALVAGVAFCVVLSIITLGWLGGHPETKYIATTSSPTLSRAIDLVRVANDFDGDGYGSLLGENDCGAFDAKVHPGAVDIPDNGVDENCDGGDFSLLSMPTYRKGERMALPEEFSKDWNFLLITVDTVRYDHTGFGGYVEKSGRDTTPRLNELVTRATNFTFANAPSAGTMASVPAILTSKFFHSGIALDENIKRGMPPRLEPSNVLLSEILKDRGGYRTGAITTHEYFNDWGMEQGFDTFDNSLGPKHDAFSVTSPALTDRALTWIARNNRTKWFLWLHYLDPHGRYVAHPGEKSFGTTEEDLYDGELHFTDKHLGRLFEELARMPGADRTVIIITSDHGDGFKEHGFINHGMALYKELLHVPLIVYVPSLPPQSVDGVVTPLDIVPTVADLAGIDVSDLSFEGESLVPQLFYGRDAHDRVVFSETNWPKKLRAAITSKYKLVYHFQNNIYELYDLRQDPWEKKNIAQKNKAALAEMSGYLNDWLERVYFSRDVKTNQAAAKLVGTLLPKAPKPKYPVTGLTYDEGRIEVLGFDVDKRTFKPGEKIEVSVYFHAAKRPSGDFKLQVECIVQGVDAAGKPREFRSHSANRLAADSQFSTSRWREGEYIRDRFPIRLTKDWPPGSEITVGLRVQKLKGGHLRPDGASQSPAPPLTTPMGKTDAVAPPPAGSPPPKRLTPFAPLAPKKPLPKPAQRLK